MNIDIRGKAKSVCKAEIKFATFFFAKYLMGERLIKNIDVELVFEDQGGSAEGHCFPTEHSRKPRAFEIGVSPSMSRRKILQCIAHEMVHVKQYAKGELSNQLVTAKWQGKTYKITNSLEDYLNWPWEIEAYGRDRSLYLLYGIMLKSEKISFKHGHVYSRGKRFTKKMLTG